MTGHQFNSLWAEIKWNLFFENIRLKVCNLIQLINPLFVDFSGNLFERNILLESVMAFQGDWLALAAQLIEDNSPLSI